MRIWLETNNMNKKITDLRNNLAEAWTLYTAVKCEIFENMSEDIISAEELAGNLGLNLVQ